MGLRRWGDVCGIAARAGVVLVAGRVGVAVASGSWRDARSTCTASKLGSTEVTVASCVAGALKPYMTHTHTHTRVHAL